MSLAQCVSHLHRRRITYATLQIPADPLQPIGADFVWRLRQLWNPPMLPRQHQRGRRPPSQRQLRRFKAREARSAPVATRRKRRVSTVSRNVGSNEFDPYVFDLQPQQAPHRRIYVGADFNRPHRRKSQRVSHQHLRTADHGALQISADPLQPIGADFVWRLRQLCNPTALPRKHRRSARPRRRSASCDTLGRAERATLLSRHTAGIAQVPASRRPHVGARRSRRHRLQRVGERPRHTMSLAQCVSQGPITPAPPATRRRGARCPYGT